MGEGITEKVLVASSFFIFFLAGFDSLTSLPRRTGTDPDSQDHITSW